MRTYPEYYDSGVEWIGEIPKGWKVRRLKYSSDLIVKKELPSVGDIKISPEDVESFTGKVINHHSDYETEGWKFQKGDTLLNKLRVYLSKFVFCESDGFSMGEMIVLRPREYLPKFQYYLISNTNIISHFNSFSRGVKVPRPPVYEILNTFCPVVPLPEQQQIVSFLDNKTSLIDTLIEKTEQKIELLKENITSYVFYKTEKTFYNDYWFQNIPKGWEILKLREVFEDITDKNHPEERLLSVHQIKGVIYRDEQEESVMNPSGDISNYKLIKEGDFVISLRSSEGGFEFSQVRGLVSPIYKVLRPKFEIDTILFKYLFKSENFIQEINRFVTGIREGKTINYKDIRDIPIPISKRVDTNVISKHYKILELLDTLEKRNKKLKEYRQSLVFEVVTGKKRVVG